MFSILTAALSVFSALFSHLGVEQGLSQSTVFSIAQDRQDRVWFATYDGLNCYDSFDMTVYRHSETDTTSLSSNLISKVYCDNSGLLWVATDAGIDLFDSDRDRFCHIYRTSEFLVSSFLDIGDGRVLVGTNKGCLLAEAKGNSFDIRPFPEFESSKNCTFARKDNLVYVAKQFGGVFVWDPSTHESHKLELTSDIVRVQDVAFAGGDNLLWISTDGDGIFVLDVKSMGMVHFLHSDRIPSICSNHVREVCEDNEGRVWIATGNNVSVWDKTDGSFRTVVADRLDPNGLSNSSVKALCLGSDGGMWLGTYFGGVNYFNSLRNNFDPVPANRSVIAGGISQAPDGSVWVGSNRNGIDVISGRNEILWHLDVSDDPERNDIKSIVFSSDGKKAYVCAAIGGLDVVDIARRKVVSNYSTPELPSPAVYDVLEETSMHLWVCSMGGLSFLDLESGKANKVDFPGLNSLPAFRIVRLQDGSYMIGAENCLVRCSLALSGSGEPVVESYERIGSVSMVQDIIQGADGIVWVASRQGFFRVDGSDCIQVELPLQTNVFRGIEQDLGGSLWIATENSLCHYNPADGETRTFSVKDGLPSNTFSAYAHCITSEGQLYFGGLSGCVRFFPASINLGGETVSPHIDRLILASGNRVVTDFSDKIELPFHDSDFRVRFNAVDYVSWQRGYFKYKLDGYDKDWRVADSKRDIEYTNLRSGEYQLSVIYFNADGRPSEKTAVARIKVLPPWYLSVFAIAVYVALVVLALFILIRMLLSREERKHELEIERIQSDNQKEIDRLSRIAERQEHDSLCERFAAGRDLEGADYDFLLNAYREVHAHLGEESFSVDELADVLGVGRTWIYVRIKKITEDSAINFIRNIRIEEACRLLRETDLTIAEVGYKVGFRTAAYFSTSFKSKTGKSPNEYRSAHKMA